MMSLILNSNKYSKILRYVDIRRQLKLLRGNVLVGVLLGTFLMVEYGWVQRIKFSNMLPTKAYIDLGKSNINLEKIASIRDRIQDLSSSTLIPSWLYWTLHLVDSVNL